LAITDPTDIANLLMWYDADDASTFTFYTGADVSTWADKSGNGFTLVTNDSNNRPTRVSAELNGRAVVRALDRSEGRGMYYPSAQTGFSRSQPLTVFAVCQFDDANESGLFEFGHTTGGAAVVRRSDNQLLMCDAPHGTGYPNTVLTVGTSTPAIVTVQYNGSSSYGRVDQAAGFTSQNPGSAGVTGFVMILNRASGSGARMLGYIAEFVVYEAALSSTDRDDVEAYLNAKWFAAAATSRMLWTPNRSRRTMLTR